VNREQIIRAWKDEEYRSGLSESERTSLPENPAGIVELSGAELEEVGGLTGYTVTIITCMTYCYVCPLPGGSLDYPCEPFTLDSRCR
jgi:mersacidin/lichenicidin family type 2 lantibiotic